MTPGLHDNPVTLCRESWQVPVDGGKPFVQCSLSMAAVCTRQRPPREFHADWFKPWGSYPAPETTTP